MATILAIGTLFLKEQTDIAAVIEREHDHSEEDQRFRDALQVQLDRRFKVLEDMENKLDAALDKGADGHAANYAAIAEARAQIGSLKETITALKETFDHGRTERQEADVNLGKRIDELTLTDTRRIDDINLRFTEIQRQVSAVEARLGESAPDKARHRTGAAGL